MLARKNAVRSSIADRTSPPVRRKAGLRSWLLAGLVLLAGFHSAYGIATKHAPGCSSYRPARGKGLIAHAAGGLPDRKYPNSIAALDTAYTHGLRVFEMDFHRLPFGAIRAGHDPSDLLDPRSAWLSEVLDWIRSHPGTRLLVDMKTDNVEGLRTIAAQAQDLRQRITPFVYSKDEYDGVRALGFSLPIYALFRSPDRDWLAFANSHAFGAVAVPERDFSLIPKVRHTVIVYTFDQMVKAPGAALVITNCMVPAPARGAASSLARMLAKRLPDAAE